MINKKEVNQFLEERYGSGLAMVDMVAHGTVDQVDRIRNEFGNADSYIEDSHRYKNKKMVVTPCIIYEDNSHELQNIQRFIEDFTRDIGGVKTVRYEIWTWTDSSENDMIGEDIKIIK